MIRTLFVLLLAIVLLPPTAMGDEIRGSGFYPSPNDSLRVLEAKDRPVHRLRPSVEVPERPNPSPGATTWTILLYDDADFYYAYDPLNDFARDAHSGPNLNVLVLRDGEYREADIWHIGENHEMTRLDDLGELNMGHPDTLRDFLLYAKANYPADRYLLACYDHGGAWRGACVDETDGDDILTMNDFQLALGEAGPVDLLCFTAPCLMGCFESVYELRESVGVYVGSEELSGYARWNGIFDGFCDTLIAAPDTPSAELGAELIRLVGENDYYQDYTYLTMSATDTSAMAGAAAAIDQLATDLIPRLDTLVDPIRLARHRSQEFCLWGAERYGLIDVHHFAEQLAGLTDDPVILDDLQAVRTAMETAVVAECHGSIEENARGLSISFPRSGRLYDPQYEAVELDFPADTAWDEFLHAYYDELDYPVLTLVTGPGPAAINPPLVRCFDPLGDEIPLESWAAYGAQAWGANVACGDLDGNGLDEIVTGPGPGVIFGPHVRGFSPSGQPVPGVSYLAYGTNRYGVNVACGDIDGDGFDEIVTGAGPGAVFGPHVRGWNVDGAAVQPVPGVSFFAYGTLKWGVNTACGDIDGDGIDEIVTGAGPGPVFGPHVRGWNIDGTAAQPIPGISYFAYGTLRYGVNVACGDIDGDGRDEILTGPGPSPVFGAQVRGWHYDGAGVTSMPEVNYFAYEYDDTRCGVRVATADVHGDGIADIITVPGPDSREPAMVAAWRVTNLYTEAMSVVEFDAYADQGLLCGGTVAGGIFNTP